MTFARQLGLEAWNPQEHNAVGLVNEITDGGGADVVFEASGSAAGARMATALAAVQGRVMIVGIQGREVPFDLFQIFYRELTVQGARAYSSGDFKEAIRLLADGDIHPAPFITHRFSLRDIQQALEFDRSNAPAMKILIKFPDES